MSEKWLISEMYRIIRCTKLKYKEYFIIFLAFQVNAAGN